MAELVYPNLSYKLVGILYKVYNELGGGYQERIYQAAVRDELINQKIGFLEQATANLYYKGSKIGAYRLDFIIEHKIVLELKINPSFTSRDILQVLGYLKQSKLKLGILASFNRRGIHFKRILKGNLD